MQNLLDTSLDPQTHLPSKTDWFHVQQPLMRAVRAAGDVGLAYTPPAFYSETSIFLPWALRVAPAQVSLYCVVCCCHLLSGRGTLCQVEAPAVR